MNNIPNYGYNHILLIHSSTDGHLRCHHLLAVVSNAGTSMSAQISLGDPALNSLGYITRSGIAEYMLILLIMF